MRFEPGPLKVELRNVWYRRKQCRSASFDFARKFLTRLRAEQGENWQQWLRAELRAMAYEELRIWRHEWLLLVKRRVITQEEFNTTYPSYESKVAVRICILCFGSETDGIAGLFTREQQPAPAAEAPAYEVGGTGKAG